MDSQINPKINRKGSFLVLDSYADKLEQLGFRVQRRKRDHGFLVKPPEYPKSKEEKEK